MYASGVPVVSGGAGDLSIITGTSDTVSKTDVSSIEGLQAAILATGKVDDIIAGTRGVIIKGHMAGDCQDPIEIYREGWSTGPSGKCRLDTSSGSAGRLRKAVAVKLRCRKCTSCLRARARYWRTAATREMGQTAIVGGRTWFGTLTLTPERHAEDEYRAYASVGGPQEFWRLAPDDQFSARASTGRRQLTLALKRLRKEVGAGAFRYLLVCEAHKSGLPHYHMLIHECSATLSIRKRQLDAIWPNGFAKWRLARPTHAGYLAKYLSKAALTRVRASRHYGSWAHPTSSDTDPKGRGKCPAERGEEGGPSPLSSLPCREKSDVATE